MFKHMTISFFVQKIKEYGIRDSFYRMLVRIIPNNFRYVYYLYRKCVFGYAILEINGVKMHLDLKNDDGLSKELILYGKREVLTVDYLLSSNTIQTGDTVLDIGGNIGYYALPESKLVGDTGVVYAVEPVKSNYELLQKNVELNGMNNVKTFQMAMGDAEREIPIYIRSKKNLSSLTELPSDARGGVVGVEKVPMTTVDVFVEKIIGKAPSFLRMDVEGFEISILEGMQKTLSGNTTLLIEFHPMFLNDKQKERIMQLLKQFHYNKVVITVNPKSELNALLKYLNKKIGAPGKPAGFTKETDLECMRDLLYTSKRVFNAFLYKA